MMRLGDRKAERKESGKSGNAPDVDNYFYEISEEYRNMSVRSWNFSGSSALDAAVSWQEKRE